MDVSLHDFEYCCQDRVVRTVAHEGWVVHMIDFDEDFQCLDLTWWSGYMIPCWPQVWICHRYYQFRQVRDPGAGDDLFGLCLELFVT